MLPSLLPAAPASTTIPCGDMPPPAHLTLAVAMVVAAHVALWGWAEWRLRVTRRRRAAILATLPAGAVALGWVVTWRGAEALAHRRPDGRPGVAGLTTPASEAACLRWLAAERLLEGIDDDAPSQGPGMTREAEEDPRPPGSSLFLW